MTAAAMVARTQSPRGAHRGSAARRRAAAKADRDGDVSMGVSAKGQARVGKTSARSAGRELLSRNSAGSSKPSILSDTARRAIIKQASTRDLPMKETRTTANRSTLVDLKVTGWDKSKASSDADRGASAVIRWMEKKASQKLGSRTRDVKIKKSRTEGTTLIIRVIPEDVASLVRMNGYGWAGTTVNIQYVDESTNAPSSSSDSKEAVTNMLLGVLERRYNLESKVLDLSALGLDEDLQKQHVFDTQSRTAKLFPALMSILAKTLSNVDERNAAITSVSLANNDLKDLEAVNILSATLPKLINLDLSNNQFPNLSVLGRWRKRFANLQHLILTGNPLEHNEPEYPAEIIKWYPNLRILNSIQVRTEEEVANKAKTAELPFPIRTASFQDEGGIVETFVRTFFTGFDNDRSGLAAHYYDTTSEFSFAVNTGAPRESASTSQPQEWERYIKNSRNLKKITQLPARQKRLFRGPHAVADVFAALPKTKHPDLSSEARKWLIEAHIQPGVPDFSEQSANGVDGFMVTVHGEFEEEGGSVGQTGKKRSFDRTFILGPGGPSGVVIVSDMLTVRAYGGTQAFEPDQLDAWTVDPAANPSSYDASTAPQLPAGLSLEMAEQMVAEVQKQTGMTLQYSKDCLDQVGWDYQRALEAFANVKQNLPVEAFALGA